MLSDEAEALTGYATAQGHTLIESVITEVDAFTPPGGPVRILPRTQPEATQKPLCSEFPQADLLRCLAHCMSPSSSSYPHTPLLYIPHQSVPGLPSRHATDHEQQPRDPVTEGRGSPLGPPVRLVRTTQPLLLMVHPVAVDSRTTLQEGDRGRALPTRTQIAIELS